MRLTVRLFAALRERAGASEIELEDLPEPLDVGTLKREIERVRPELGSLAHVRGVIGTRYAREEEPIEPGADVSLLPPVSGGSSAEDERLERGLFELHASALDPAEAERRVRHASCGASLVFTGTTRGRNRGRDVLRLDYEAFQGMAQAEMGRIFAECRERFGPGSEGEGPEERILRMLVVHRTGVVGVGEPSVVIAVASPHRDSAFQACRFLIDELKSRVPLWKKELYSDGHHWIHDRS